MVGDLDINDILVVWIQIEILGVLCPLAVRKSLYLFQRHALAGQIIFDLCLLVIGVPCLIVTIIPSGDLHALSIIEEQAKGDDVEEFTPMIGANRDPTGRCRGIFAILAILTAANLAHSLFKISCGTAGAVLDCRFGTSVVLAGARMGAVAV